MAPHLLPCGGQGVRPVQVTPLGALDLSFSVRLQDLAFALGWRDWASSDQLTIQATLFWPMGMVLISGVLLLPRCSQGFCGP